jgi:ATP-dependent helicase STH1/SNF2
MQRLLIPSVMPRGLDAREVMKERERYLEGRVKQRIRELEGVESTWGERRGVAEEGKEVLMNASNFSASVTDGEEKGKEKENKDPAPSIGDDGETKPPQPQPLSLAGLSALAPNSTSSAKLKALIELKGLQLLDKQRMMRAAVAERLVHGSLVPLNRQELRR